MIDDTECWSARNLQELLGYSLWQNFINVIDKAKAACENVGQLVSDHFIDVNKMIKLVRVLSVRWMIFSSPAMPVTSWLKMVTPATSSSIAKAKRC